METEKKLKKIKKHLNKVYDILGIPKDERIYALNLSTEYGVGTNRVLHLDISSKTELDLYTNLAIGDVYLGVKK